MCINVKRNVIDVGIVHCYRTSSVTSKWECLRRRAMLPGRVKYLLIFIAAIVCTCCRFSAFVRKNK